MKPKNISAYSLFTMDKDLFQRVIPWQCLGSVWSRRGSGADIQTVKATVRQFNKVVFLGRFSNYWLKVSSLIQEAPSSRHHFENLSKCFRQC